MQDKALFEEKTVPARKLSKWEIDEKIELARKHGIDKERLTRLIKFYRQLSG
jgi:hypothetical protein